MLQIPSKTTQNVIKMAEFFSELPADRYRQSAYLTENGDRCICGWVNWHTCHMPGDTVSAAEHLGIDAEQAALLFNSWPFAQAGVASRAPNPQQAAKVLRHLAATGEVDWLVAA